MSFFNKGLKFLKLLRDLVKGINIHITAKNNTIICTVMVLILHILKPKIFGKGRTKFSEFFSLKSGHTADKAVKLFWMAIFL